MSAFTDVEVLDHTMEPEADTEARIADGIWTTTVKSPDHSISQLIRGAEHSNNDWHIEGLWEPNTFSLVHSLEGEFKSIFAYQVAEALATGQPLLRKWNVLTPKRVGVLGRVVCDAQHSIHWASLPVKADADIDEWDSP